MLRALAERWWATTNTFHFGFGEMAVTPLDFSMLTGLRCGGGPIPWYRDLQRTPEVLSYYLGMPASESSMLPGYISCFALREYYRHYDYSTPETRDTLPRAFILYMLGTSLFSSVDNTVSLGPLVALVDFNNIARYDWGGAGLATMYGYMGGIAHRLIMRTCGFYHIWEVCNSLQVFLRLPYQRFCY